MFPGGGKANLPGYSSANLYEIQDTLRITTTWRQGQVEGMSLPFYGPAQAVATGEARHVVVYRTVKEGSAARNAGGRPAYGSIHAGGRRPAGLAAARSARCRRCARSRRTRRGTCTTTA